MLCTFKCLVTNGTEVCLLCWCVSFLPFMSRSYMTRVSAFWRKLFSTNKTVKHILFMCFQMHTHVFHLLGAQLAWLKKFSRRRSHPFNSIVNPLYMVISAWNGCKFTFTGIGTAHVFNFLFVWYVSFHMMINIFERFRRSR